MDSFISRSNNLGMDLLRGMTTFVRIVDGGSLTAAALALGTSLPSVVRTLAALEGHLGARLLNRTTRRIHLTEEGAQYLERCRVILSGVQEAEAGLASGNLEPQGMLAVTASVLFGRRYVAPIVSEFVRRHRHVSANMLFVDRFVNLVDEGLDVGVRIGHLGDSSLVAIPVGQVRRVVCATPQYLRQHGTPRTPAEIQLHRCIRHTGLSPRSEWHFRAGQRSVVTSIHSVVTCNDIDSSLSACMNGLGLGMFLSYQVAAGRKSGKLECVLEEFEMKPLPVQIIYPHSRLLSTKVRAFVDVCAGRLRQIGFD
jgi:DNA-binding transcriptional LysR family regulator